MILQALVGGAAAVAVTARLWWRRLRNRLGVGEKEEERQAQP